MNRQTMIQNWKGDVTRPAERRQIWLPGVLYGLFFLSGFPALLYQIVWQRALFAIYGVNIESVTIVVSAFMLGLGVGSLAGGLLSERPRVPLLLIFGTSELGIASFGVFSIKIFHFVSLFTAGASPLKTGVCTFLLLVIPTALMGSTLPILVTYLVRVSKNVGRSVGILYFVNTLGSAASCFCAAFLTMHYLGQSGSVRLAAALNATIGAAMILVYWRTRNAPAPSDRVRPATRSSPPDSEMRLFPLPLAVAVSGLAGLISLGYEILWYRIFSFFSSGQAPAFALLLGFYLAGIAFGSLTARVFCHHLNRESLGRHLRLLAGWVILANLVAYLVIPLASRLATIPVSHHAWLRAPAWYWSYAGSLAFVAVATMLLGAIFPLICHAAVKPSSGAGTHLGFLYLSNIAGSTSGSFIVGYILMDIWTTKEVAVSVALTGLALGAALFLGSNLRLRTAAIAAGVGVVMGALVIGSTGRLFDALYERLQLKAAYTPGYRFQHVVENKSGVITVTKEGMVYGGGVYDGMFTTDVIHDKNGLNRPYSVSLWHPAPRKVLMIGLASGSWAQVLANHPQLEHLTIVEINPGYLGLIPQYPAVSSLLKNPKTDFVIDDGRRWLFRNPGASFDVIVMNTVYHWRAHSTNLLSVDFLRMIRSHLKPGGVLFYNATGSGEVQLTGATVFPHALMVGNCIAVSDFPLNLNWERWAGILRQYRIDGRLSFDIQRADDRQRFQELMSMPVNQPGKDDSIEYAESIRARNKGKSLVTDDNMGSEWPGIRFHSPAARDGGAVR